MSRNAFIVGAALQYSQQAFGGPLVESDSVISVDTTPVVVAKGNGDRVALVIINLGTVNVFVTMTGTPSSGRGILLAPAGGSVTMSVITDFTLTSREFVAAAAAGGPSNVYILEMSRYSLTPTA